MECNGELMACWGIGNTEKIKIKEVMAKNGRSQPDV
jgi:hypothetical protein